MKKGLFIISCLMLFATKSHAFVATQVGFVARVNVIAAVPVSPCMGGCGMGAMPYGYGSHGAYGYGYGGGYGYGYGYGYGGRYVQGGTCGRCHRRIHYAHGRRACGCRGRGGFALAINTPSFGFGLSIF